MAETVVMTLTDFLLARIAEDEAVAKAATPGPWRDTPMGSEGSIVQAGGNTIRTARKPATCREFGDATHIARHDPARVLAECEAKRRIVERYRTAADETDAAWKDYAEWIGSADKAWRGEHPPPRSVPAEELNGLAWAVAALALPYADHPDFRDEWRP